MFLEFERPIISTDTNFFVKPKPVAGRAGAFTSVGAASTDLVAGKHGQGRGAPVVDVDENPADGLNVSSASSGSAESIEVEVPISFSASPTLLQIS
jgi:hypothetical protein